MIALSAGPLSATLDGFALRWLRWHGVELLRGVAFVVRDEGWGTYAPAVQAVSDVQDGAVRRLVLRATAVADGADLACEMRVAFGPDRVTMEGAATALGGGFATNRTGFVVLHGEACAGEAVTVEHTDGAERHAHFPDLISPHQPFFDLRALAHEPHPGVVVRCRMEGEAFEMEDHRNWSDAGFKTYGRPLREPRPLIIADGATLRQKVEVSVEAAGTALPPAEARRVLSAGPECSLPRLGVTAPASGYAVGSAALRGLARLHPSLLAVETEGSDDLAAFAEALRVTGRPGAVLLGGTGERTAAIAAVAAAMPGIETLLLSEAAPAALAHARAALPGARIGAGTAGNFTEFNREPPPEGADLVFWTVRPTVHASDDASAMETLRVLGDQARTAAALRPGVERWVGPVTLRRRWQDDPRQRTAFGAAFLLGHVAAWAEAGIGTVLLQEPFGAGGFLDEDGNPQTPAGTLLAGLAGAAGDSCRVLRGTGVVALATARKTWIANLTPDALEVSLEGRRIALGSFEVA